MVFSLVPMLPVKLLVLAMTGLLTSPKEITISYASQVRGALPKVNTILVKDPAEVKALLAALEIQEVAFVQGSSARPEAPPASFVQFGRGGKLVLGPDELAEIDTDSAEGTVVVQFKPGFIKEVNRIASKHARRPIDVLGINKDDM